MMSEIITKDVHRDLLLKMIKEFGVKYPSELVGSTNKLINFLFKGDLREFYKKTNTKPYVITNNNLTMCIDDVIISTLHLPNGFLKGEVHLGNFVWYSQGSNYSVKVFARPYTSKIDGQKKWRVMGVCGDYGFGYAFISQKNTIGVRGRTQIYKQIIEQYQLNNYE